ncbi:MULTISPECIES: hypothetical protein [unclassified Streptomyces]|uniref:hypothetical protein n=1 Tax=unclassified Streptomyces TaxID=2593676 RepID=UPI002E1174B6|nr:MULTISPECIES: hypothetical protein [unclassified Streptomyces]WSR27120.1 hypothetical protein OG573_13925 [Streptomyces sp. NBC_01205]
MGNKKEIVRWAPVALLLVLALVAPLFGDSPTAVAVPLLLAVVFGCVNLMQQKREQARDEG